MKSLEKYFIGKGEVRGFEFEQLESNGRAYLYKVRTPIDNRIHYEIFKHRENTRFNCVSYPGSKVFGDSASTTRDHQKALILYAEMANKGLYALGWMDRHKSNIMAKMAVQ